MKNLWQTLALPSETPRSTRVLQGIDLAKGLQAWKGFGMFAFAGVGMCLAGIFLINEPTFPKGPMVFSAIVLTAIGSGFLRHARRQLALRREAMLTGIAVEGSVIRHGKKFNIFSSSSHMTVAATFLVPDGQILSEGILPRPEALKDLPKGSRVKGLWLRDKGQIWLPLEAGLKLEADVLEPAEITLETSETEENV